VVVEPDGRCGARALTFPSLANHATLPGARDPIGRLILPGQPRPLAARVSMEGGAPGRERALTIIAVEEGGPSAFLRRIFPFNAVMARLGASGCTPPVS